MADIELPEVGEGEGAPRGKSMTIGAVCKALAQEFPDISISKIRYLEDQKLLAPRRTPGGYRLYAQGDVQRLRTILRMQRDEFLPLRVIRQELAAGRAEETTLAPGRSPRDGGRVWRPSVSVREATGALYSMEDVLQDTKAEDKLVSELEEYGVVKGELRGGVRYFDETEREIIAAVAELARYGARARARVASARARARDPRLPPHGHRLQGHHPADGRPRRARAGAARARGLRAPAASRLRRRGRGARLPARPRARARARRRL